VAATVATHARIVLWHNEGRQKKDVAALAGVSRKWTCGLVATPRRALRGCWTARAPRRGHRHARRASRVGAAVAHDSFAGGSGHRAWNPPAARELEHIAQLNHRPSHRRLEDPVELRTIPIGGTDVGRAQWCVPSQSIEGCLEEQSALPLWSCGAVSVTAHRQTPARWREKPPEFARLPPGSRKSRAILLFDGCRLGRGRRSSQWNGSLNRSELEVQFLEAPEQKGAVPFEPTSACRTVLGL